MILILKQMARLYRAFIEIMCGLPTIIKTPSSLAEESMNVDIFKVATERDLIKFVVGSPEDLDCMRRIISKYPTVAQIYVSPVWGQIEAASIIDYMKTYNLQNVRFQLQIHKFVWDPDAKGV